MLESVFDKCLVLLCSVHTGRYFREKVLTGKAYWGDISEKKFLNGSDKDDILSQVLQVRDAPSQELYIEREEKLLYMTRELSIRPGQANKPVAFKDYYEKKRRRLFDGYLFITRIYQQMGQRTPKPPNPLSEPSNITVN